MTKSGTVGMSPITAIEQRNAIIQPKNRNPRMRMVLPGRCPVFDSMSMWIFVGGDELFSEVTTAEATNSATYANLTTVGPSVTVPRAGDYLIEVGSEIALSAGAQTAWVSFDIAGAGAVDADGFRASGTSSLVAQGSRMRKKTSVAVFSTVIAKYKSDGTNNATYGRRWMRVKPIRVS